MIEINHISKNFNAKKALDNINLKIEKGTIVGLLGPNGAGKTTLIRILTGILIPDKGNVLINGSFLNKMNRNNIGYLPEERGLYKKMKVGDQAIYLALLKGLSYLKAEVELKKWFRKLQILDWWEKDVDSLSKGMQQRIQFIVSVVHEPELLILDEPFSGLDPLNMEIIGNEIIELNKNGTTIILSTHNMNSVEEYCDSAILINDGREILSGKIYDLKNVRRSFIYEFQFQDGFDHFIHVCEEEKIKILLSNKENDTYSVKLQFCSAKKAELFLLDNISKIRLTLFREILPSMNDIFIESIKK